MKEIKNARTWTSLNKFRFCAVNCSLMHVWQVENVVCRFFENNKLRQFYVQTEQLSSHHIIWE